MDVPLKYSILYVDDEEINLDLFKINFKKEFDVHLAISASEGMRLLKDYPEISVIISDLKMPEINGLEFIDMIKVKYPEKICIILTGFIDHDIMYACKNEENVFNYIVKPWEKDELKVIIDSAYLEFCRQMHV